MRCHSSPIRIDLSCCCDLKEAAWTLIPGIKVEHHRELEPPLPSARRIRLKARLEIPKQEWRRGGERRINLTIALARVRGDPVLTQGPVARPSAETLRRRLAGRLKAAPVSVYLGAALASVLIGIGVNALILQRERHPAPLFGPAPAADSPAAPAPALPLPPQSASADRETSAAGVSPASPPVRPVDAVDSSPSRAADPITGLLREEARADVARLTLAAQTALVRLGYPVKPDGNEGVTTQQALHDFERVHGLPLSTEITPRLVKQLVMAARATGR
jgi:hypothetical protein